VAEDIKPVDVSIVIPCFRSQGSLQPLLQRITDAMESADKSYELILINDGLERDSRRRSRPR
jgi:glycosyltransferase involved in cell wall biosynthesis